MHPILIIDRYPIAGTDKHAIRAVYDRKHIAPEYQLELAQYYGSDSVRYVERLQELGKETGYQSAVYVGNWTGWKRRKPKDGPL